MRGVKNYITRKQYCTSFGDLVPVIATRALKIGLFLKNVQSVYNIHIIEHHSDKDKVFVVKAGDHHDAAVLINDEPLCEENNVERLVVTHIMLRNADNDIVYQWGSCEYWRCRSTGIVILQPGPCSSGGDQRSHCAGVWVGVSRPLPAERDKTNILGLVKYVTH